MDNTTPDNDLCDFCGGSLQPKILLYYDYPWGDKAYRFENVPAHVCASCGEIYFGAAVSQAMNKAVASGSVPKRYDQVPVLELSFGAKAHA